MGRLKRLFTLFFSFTVVFSVLGFTPIYAKSEVDITNPVTLTWYFIGDGPQKDTTKVEKRIHEYLMDNYKMNTRVKLICYDWGRYPENMPNIIDSGQKFDICFTSSWSNNYYTQALKGAFLPLNDFLPEYAPKTKALLGEDFLKGSQIDGINYAIPANSEKARQIGLLLRKDLVTKYNMDITKIKSLSNLEPMLALIKANEPKVEPLKVLEDNASILMALDFDFIGESLPTDLIYPGVIYSDSKDMKVFNEYEKPETKDFFKTMHKFYALGYVCNEISNRYDYSFLNHEEKVFAGLGNITPSNTRYLNYMTGYDWIAVPLGPTIMTTQVATSSMQAISATSPNPERALMFLELVNTDEYLNNLVNSGIENVHYIKTGKKSIQPTDNASNYCFQLGWMFGNTLLNYTKLDESPNYPGSIKDFNEKVQPSKALGFIFNTSNVEKEIQACDDVWYEYMPALRIGAKDPDVYLPRMIQALKAAGSDKIIAEKQNQLDAWLAQCSK